MKYIVPEYYDDFRCKCGECRHSCCEGWSIRISMKEYYYLLGVKCSGKLRALFDNALKLSYDQRNECYALISSDWHGICKLHSEDGLCALQMELGESSLPDVCRLYPRTTKSLTEVNKSSCSNSCEEVIELLIKLKEPMRFEAKDLSVIPEFLNNLSPEKYDCCKNSISIIQDRSLSLPERFIILGNYLHGSDFYIKKADGNLSSALQVLYVFDKHFENSISIDEYCKVSQIYFGIEGDETPSTYDLNAIAGKHLSASEHVDLLLPDWQILFEQLIVNHMFYINFPYTDNQEKVNDAFLSLATMYSFLRFNILGYLSDHTNTDKLVDFLAAMFRLIEHSNFKNISASLIKNEIYPTQDCVPQLLYV